MKARSFTRGSEYSDLPGKKMICWKSGSENCEDRRDKQPQTEDFLKVILLLL